MRPLRQFLFYGTLAAAIAITPFTSDAQMLSGSPTAPPKHSPNVPGKITTPDTVETRIGTLRFRDGTPDAATAQLAYDQLDFGRGINAFLMGMSATSVYAACGGFEEAGIKLNQGIGISEDLLDFGEHLVSAIR